MFINYLGWGAVMPLELVYLHDGRGFSLGTSGLIVGIVTGLAVLAAPISGPAIDRFGARPTAALAGVALAVGYCGLALAQTPVIAFAAAAIAGAGNGVLLPGQSALMASLAAPELRLHVPAISRVASNIGAALGAALGGLVATQGLSGFMALYFGNAATYLVYAVSLLTAVRREVKPNPMPGGYRLVLRDRAFRRVALINVAMIAVGWGIFTWVVPAYARSQAGLGVNLIGLMLTANALTVVVGQLPVARFSEGRRRSATMATAAATFVVASLLVLLAGRASPYQAYALLLAAAIGVGVGECFHTTVLMPLVADMAPPALRGRYMATIGLSWWLGLALAPTIGGELLGLSPPLPLLASAAVALAAGVAAVALDHSLPATIRLTPKVRPAGGRR